MSWHSHFRPFLFRYILTLSPIFPGLTPESARGGTPDYTYSEEELFSLKNILGLKCLICGKHHRPEKVDYVCPDHGDEGILDVIYDYDVIGRQISRDTLMNSNIRSIWRYLPLLPIHPDATLPPL